ncbi:MAG: NAD(P)H-hydrate dehydratase [Clostridia bacterium]|nr:NAD(P)H-hydrate dehydratase [Clostridia bacterium]
MLTPIPLLTAQQMRDCDAHTIQVRGIPSQLLMERAARAAIEVMQSHTQTELRAGREILFLCGSGNNGGDGFAMARFLTEEGCGALVAYAGQWDEAAQTPLESHMSVECARQYRLWTEAGGRTVCQLPPLEGRIIVDALLGTDLRGAPRPPMDTWIRAVNESDCPVIAIDVPSGVDASSGAVYVDGAALHSVDQGQIPVTAAVRADVTATMAYPKRGLILYPGAALAGLVHICDIGIDCKSISPEMYLLRAEHLSLLPMRPTYANKGTFGRVAIIGGAVGMCGAVCFAGKAALRAGIGLCELVSSAENRIPLQTLLPEAVMTLLPEMSAAEEVLCEVLSRADVAVVGCGMGQSAVAHDRLAHILSMARCPLVLDADALNMIAADDKGIYRARLRACAARNTVVITPHLGEASRLLHKGIRELLADLPSAAAALAREYGVICVLKDTRTIISDGHVAYVQDCGNSSMAKGGSGDVLAGVMGAMLCICRRTPLADTPTLLAALAVLLHAMAGDSAAEAMGAYAPMAGELADHVGAVLKDI